MGYNEVFLVDGKRTPQSKAYADLKDVSAPYLATNLIRTILDAQSIPVDAIDEVIIGNVASSLQYTNIARIISLNAGLDETTPAYTVNRNCGSGMEALRQGAMQINANESELVFAGGVESMSEIPFLVNQSFKGILLEFMKAKTLEEKFKLMLKMRPSYFKPVNALKMALTDPICQISMGEIAENIASLCDITRIEQDAFAQSSHQKAYKAQQEDKFKDEIVPILKGDKREQVLESDVGIRSDSSMVKLSSLKPFFNKKFGTVTVGNSCPVTDGASLFLLSGKTGVEKYNLNPIARVVDVVFVAIDPAYMGMGPLKAMSEILKRNKLTVSDIDLFEINEAFASIVLGVQKGMKDLDIAQKFGVTESLGEIPDEKLNVNGGAISLGHPVGSSGCRIVVTMAHELKRRNGKYGLASLCIGGGQGGAILIER